MLRSRSGPETPGAFSILAMGLSGFVLTPSRNKQTTKQMNQSDSDLTVDVTPGVAQETQHPVRRVAVLGCGDQGGAPEVVLHSE